MIFITQKMNSEMEQDAFITIQFKNAVTGESTGENLDIPANSSVESLTKFCNSLLEKVFSCFIY